MGHELERLHAEVQRLYKALEKANNDMIELHGEHIELKNQITHLEELYEAATEETIKAKEELQQYKNPMLPASETEQIVAEDITADDNSLLRSSFHCKIQSDGNDWNQTISELLEQVEELQKDLIKSEEEKKALRHIIQQKMICNQRIEDACTESEAERNHRRYLRRKSKESVIDTKKSETEEILPKNQESERESIKKQRKKEKKKNSFVRLFC